MIYKIYEQHTEGFLPVIKKFMELDEEVTLKNFAEWHGAKHLFNFLNINFDIKIDVEFDSYNEYIDSIAIANNGDIEYHLIEYTLKSYDRDEPPEEEIKSETEHYVDGEDITIEIVRSIDEKGVFYLLDIDN